MALRSCGKATQAGVRARASSVQERSRDTRISRRDALVQGASGTALLANVLTPGPNTENALASQVVSKYWERVDLPLDESVILLDLDFVPDEPSRGFLTGTKQTLLETSDSGRTWQPRDIPVEEGETPNYRLSSVSFSGKEGWIAGKPNILLHTTDGGRTWERVPLSPRLPGSPLSITALSSSGRAELVTDEGAIYTTEDAAQNWRANVEEFPSATLNRTVSSGISGASYFSGNFIAADRRDDGTYVATASRGNFYMTWEPGQTYWRPHNRATSRRIQKMGFRKDGGLWELTRGGSIFYSRENDVPTDDYNFEEKRVGSRGFGILDLAYKDDSEAWASGGSGNLFKSEDGGKTWKRDKAVDQLPANLYEVKFFDNGSGFVLGNNNCLLRCGPLAFSMYISLSICLSL